MPSLIRTSRPTRLTLPLTLTTTTLLLTACGSSNRAAPVTTPPPPPLTVDLLFDHETADGTRQLYRARLDSTPPAPVPGGTRGVRPHARLDGSAIVFASQPESSWDPSQLMLLDALSPPARRLSLDPPVIEREATFAPDGQRLAFVSQRDDPGGADIFVATLHNGALTDVVNLTPGPTSGDSLDLTPAWSPDGTQIAFTSYRNQGVAALWIMRADGGDARQITEVPANGEVGDHFPAWSPDGQYLAFQRRTRDVMRIGIVPTAGGLPAFFEFAGSAYSPAWSPDGAWIAFSGLVDGEIDLYVLDVDASGPPWRLVHPGPDRNPSWVVRD